MTYRLKLPGQCHLKEWEKRLSVEILLSKDNKLSLFFVFGIVIFVVVVVVRLPFFFFWFLLLVFYFLFHVFIYFVFLFWCSCCFLLLPRITPLSSILRQFFSHEVVFYGLNSVLVSAKYQTASIKSYSDWVQASCFLTIVQHRLDRFVKPAWWFPRWSQRRR